VKMSPMDKSAREVAQRLRAHGHIAYFAGGCVRDTVRGLAAKDFDVATDATPEIVQKIFPHTYAVGAHFGVVVVVENGMNFEVATFRADGAYVDHRHPLDVRFSSPEEDAKRRDFTINGMFFDPEKNVVIDYVGGRADLDTKLIRAIGKPVTSTVDPTGRIRFNEHDRIGAAMAESIMERLRFSRAEIDAAVEMVRQHMVFKDVPKMRVAKLKRFMARPTFEEELELHRVDCASSHRMMDNYEFLLQKREEFANEPIIPPPLVRGDDLIALGMKPGPKFGEILEAVETKQLEGALKDRLEALDWIKREYLP